MRAADDPALALALSAASSHAVRLERDPLTGAVAPAAVACLDSATLRRALKADAAAAAAAAEDAEGAAEGAAAGVADVGAKLGAAARAARAAQRVHLPVFVLSLDHPVLLDCDPLGGAPTGERSADGLLIADGPEALHEAKHLNGLVVAVQGPATLDSVRL